MSRQKSGTNKKQQPKQTKQTPVVGEVVGGDATIEGKNVGDLGLETGGQGGTDVSLEQGTEGANSGKDLALEAGGEGNGLNVETGTEGANGPGTETGTETGLEGSGGDTEEEVTVAHIVSVLDSEKLSPQARSVFVGLQAYIERMAPEVAQSDDTGKNRQRDLYNNILDLLRLDSGEFGQAITDYLQVVHENREGCFAERYVYRFFDAVPLSVTEREKFSALLNLFIVTCDGKRRADSLKNVDVNKTIALLNEEEGALLGEYFGRFS